MTETTVFITTNFEGQHRWPEAPESVAFLRNLHRHLFGVRVEVIVTNDDRQVEYFELKKATDIKVCDYVLPQLVVEPRRSCEMMADQLFRLLDADGYRVRSVEVNEDGENGSIIRKI